VQNPHGLRRAGEELELSIARTRRTKREHLKRKPIVSIARQYRKTRHKALAHSVEAPFLTLQAGKNLPLPALLDALDPRR
jgi:hypothetical protein